MGNATLAPLAELEAERQTAQLNLARAVRYGREEEAAIAGRDFAFAKARVELTKLIADYPPMTAEQRLALQTLVNQ